MYKELSDGTQIPVLGFGTYKLHNHKCTEMVKAALELGYRHIDTATVYQNHEAVAEGMKGYSREEIYLTSKITPEEYHPDVVEKSVNRMLKELQTEYLNLLLIHWPDRSVLSEETFDALDKIRQSGKIRSIGVSNFTHRHCQEALVSGVQIVVNQVEFHPYLYQRDLLEWSTQNKMALMAYCPIARGKIAHDPVLLDISANHNKSWAQVSLRWLIQHGLLIIPKTAHLERLKENAELFDFELSSEEMSRIDDLNKNERIVSGAWTDFSYV